MAEIGESSNYTNYTNFFLGDCRKRTYQITEDFCSSSRRENGRIAGLCHHFRNKEEGQKDTEDSMFFDRNRLKTGVVQRSAQQVRYLPKPYK
jgi:2-oxoglutarate dehydrogenase complex dehydrogenase (E1) component-like enzyme